MLSVNGVNVNEILNKISNRYSFAFSNLEEFSTFIYDSLLNINKEYSKNSQISFMDYASKKLISYLNSYIKKSLENDINFINKYVTLYMKDTDCEKDSLFELTKLIKLFNIFNFEPDIEDCSKLIVNNDKISKNIKNIVDNNIESIKEIGSDSITKEEVINTFILAYCSIYDIEIGDDLKKSDLESVFNTNGSSNKDSVRAYLTEISEFDLLTKQEETELAKRIAMGDEEAMKKLVEANLRLVVFIAKKHNVGNTHLLDLIQEGNIGLMKAAQRFDATKGFKFSTYASWWIRQAITRYLISRDGIIRLPVYTGEMINKILFYRAQLTSELNRKPTDMELADKLNISVEKLSSIINTTLDTVSLEVPVGEEENSYLGDFMYDKDALLPEQLSIIKSLKEDVSKVLSMLGEKEEQVIRLRFGFYDGKIYSLREIGMIFGFSRERVRQIEIRALEKISRLEQLNDYNVNNTLPSSNKENTILQKAQMKNSKIFSSYTPEKINAVVENLTLEERKLWMLKNSDLAEKDRVAINRKFYAGFLYLKMKNKLQENDHKKIVDTKNEKDYYEEISSFLNMGAFQEEPRSAKNIYDYFDEYSTDEVDFVINILDRKEQEILQIRNIANIPQSIISFANDEFNNKLYLKMKRKLYNLRNYCMVNNSKKSKNIYDLFSEYTETEIDYVILSLSDEEKELIILRDDTSLFEKQRQVVKKSFYSRVYYKMKKRLLYNRSINMGNSIKFNFANFKDNAYFNYIREKNSITKADYVKMLKMIKNPYFIELKKKISSRDAVIVFLAFGDNIIGKSFSIKTISNFLDIDEAEIIDIIKQAFLYKDYLSEIFNKPIQMTEKENYYSLIRRRDRK